MSEIISNGGVAYALNPEDPNFTEDIEQIIEKAAVSWLKNDEVLAVLETFQTDREDWPTQAAQQPPGGKLFIFNRKVCRSFRNDTHNWRKKADGRTVKETHEKLKVADQERLNCYYAHADTPDGLQRRCYWILDEPKADIVLVHYLCCASSRAGGQRASAGAYIDNGATIAANRPRRAAAQRARTLHATIDDDDEPASISTRPSSSEYVPSSGDLPTIGDGSGPYFSGSVPMSNAPSSGNVSVGQKTAGSGQSLHEIHAQWLAAQAAGGNNAAVRAASSGGREGGVNGAGSLGRTTTTTDDDDAGGEGPNFDNLPLFTQMSLGSAGDSQNLSALLAGVGGLDSLTDPLSSRQLSRDESMKAIHKEFAEDPVNYSQLLNDLPSFSIPSASWKRNTGLDAEAAAQALEHRSIKFDQQHLAASNAAGAGPSTAAGGGGSVRPNPRDHDSPLLAGDTSLNLNLLPSSDSSLGVAAMLADPKTSGSDRLSGPLMGSSGGMSIRGSGSTQPTGGSDKPHTVETPPLPPSRAAAGGTNIGNHNGNAPTSVSPPSGGTGTGFVVGRVKELEDQEGYVHHSGGNHPTHRRSGSGDDVAFARRSNPTAALARPSAADRSAAAANAAVAVTHEHRELQLHKARQARLVSPYEDDQGNHENGGLNDTSNGAGTGVGASGITFPTIDEQDTALIDAPNHLFRMTSHVVRAPWMSSGSGGSSGGMSIGGPELSAEQTASLLKHMSIDEAAAIADLRAVQSSVENAAAAAVAEVDNFTAAVTRNTDTGGATGSDDKSFSLKMNSSEAEPAGNESRDPSLSSLLQGMTMPSSGVRLDPGASGDVLEQAMARHLSNAAAKREGRVIQPTKE